MTRHGNSLPVSILQRNMGNCGVLVACAWRSIRVVLNGDLDMFQPGICAWLGKLSLVDILPGIIADQMELQTCCCCNAERLLKKTTLFVLKSVFLFLGAGNRVLLVSFHFSISQERATNSACAPCFSICPSSHRRFTLIPDIDGA